MNTGPGNLRRGPSGRGYFGRSAFPLCTPGQKIGLFGGSFDPAHAGHEHVAQTALRALGLDAIWWIPSADHPFKRGQTPFAVRFASAARFASHARHKVTALEARIGSRRSLETVRAIQSRLPGVRFVWVMGADSFVELSHWHRWQTLARRIGFCVVARPGAERAALHSVAARWIGRRLLRPASAKALASRRPPAWVYLPAPLHDLASRDLRALARHTQ